MYSIYPRLKSERLSVGTELILYKGLIMFIRIDLCLPYMGIRGAQPSFEIAVSAKQNSPHRNLHMMFKIPYLYDFTTKLCREQATVILNHENVNTRIIGQGEARHKNYKALKLGGG
jgi:hypothetical protein